MGQIKSLTGRKPYKEKKNSSGINLLPKHFVHAKQCDRWHQVQVLLEALNFMISTLCITIAGVPGEKP